MEFNCKTGAVVIGIEYKPIVYNYLREYRKSPRSRLVPFALFNNRRQENYANVVGRGYC